MIDFRLYLITDRHACAPRELDEVVGAACAAGVRAVQLREKDLADDALDTLAGRVLKVTRTAGARLLINQFKGVTTRAAVDGIHFPEDAPGLHAMRERFPGMLAGASAHSRAAAQLAAADGADFIVFGPIFETPSKAEYGPAKGLAALEEVVAGVPVPVFAVGGVTPGNAIHCVESGAHGVAVVRAVMCAADVAAAVGAFADAIGEL